MPRVVEVPLPSAMQPRDGDDAFRRRVLSEVDDRIRGMAEGLARHVQDVVKQELAPYVGQLSRIDDVVALLEEDREERIRYRAAREEREKLEREQRKADMHKLSMQRGHVEIQRMNVDVKQAPIEASRKYRLALLGLLVTLAVGLAGLGGACLGSHH